MRILIAEDDPVSRRLLQATLEKWEHEVVVCKDGSEAWQALQQDETPRLIILDWMMPGMSGIEVCRRVRKMAKETYSYILLLTAKSQIEDIIVGMGAGADDYITKPFDKNELKARLRAGKRILTLQEELIKTREVILEQATHDTLSGLYNREHTLGTFKDIVERTWTINKHEFKSTCGWYIRWPNGERENL